MSVQTLRKSRRLALLGAFGYALVLIGLSLVINEALRIAYSSNQAVVSWMRQNASVIRSTTMLLTTGLWLALAYPFSRADSIQGFICEQGFNRRPTLFGWAASWGAVALGLLEIYFVKAGFTASNQSAPRFYNKGEAAWAFFVLYTTVISPCAEELAMRGFLYRAFRQTYGVALGIALVLCINGYFHWGLISNDPLELVLFTAGNILLCGLRERTGSTWNCVMFHSVYNATVIREWALCILGMIVVLPSCSQFVTATGGACTNAKQAKKDGATN